MTSRFAVLEVRPSGKEACRTAQEKAGGRNQWNGVLPLRTLLVEQPAGADEPTGYWMTCHPGLPHPATGRPKSTYAGLTLYQVLDVLQDLLRCWTGTCTTRGRPLTDSRSTT
ncbi:hypothetical protein [Streptomyces katrae]|uniref:hypothetical protein n=1 Tax=Streptomyces katrae TaxID=68223 RepID=UPI000AEF1A77